MTSTPKAIVHSNKQLGHITGYWINNGKKIPFTFNDDPTKNIQTTFSRRREENHFEWDIEKNKCTWTNCGKDNTYTFELDFSVDWRDTQIPCIKSITKKTSKPSTGIYTAAENIFITFSEDQWNKLRYFLQINFY